MSTLTRAESRASGTNGSMRAAVFEAPGRITLHERPIPEIGPNDALVRVAMTTICGTDVHILRGEYPVAPGRSRGYRTARPTAAAAGTRPPARWSVIDVPGSRSTKASTMTASATTMSAARAEVTSRDGARTAFTPPRCRTAAPGSSVATRGPSP